MARRSNNVVKFTHTSIRERREWRRRVKETQGYLDCFLSEYDFMRLVDDANALARLQRELVKLVSTPIGVAAGGGESDPYIDYFELKRLIERFDRGGQ